MFGDWQILTSVIITALAGAYVGWRFWGSAWGAGCKACSRCSGSTSDRQPRIIPLVDANSLANSARSIPKAEDT